MVQKEEEKSERCGLKGKWEMYLLLYYCINFGSTMVFLFLNFVIAVNTYITTATN